jgi:TRAP-type C4-dicarboxylate transport system permease small subunit
MRVLDKVYAAGIILAAIFMVLIAGLTLAQVLGRLFGVVIPDAGDFAGYAMAGATFMAFAHTFRTGGHIRVNLLLTHVPARVRWALEVWCVLFLCVVGALFAGFAINMVLDSYAFGDVSTGMMGIPLWIPQLSMAAGAVLLELAALEELLRVWRGQEPLYARAESDGFTE